MPSAGRSSARVSTLDLGNVHSFQVTIAANCFQTLGIGAALFHRDQWHAIHARLSPVLFELAHGKGSERHTYNTRSVERVRTEKRTLLTHHAGFSDFFVPVFGGGEVQAVLITGPFAT